jgi:hypothetical protein
MPVPTGRAGGNSNRSAREQQKGRISAASAGLFSLFPLFPRFREILATARPSRARSGRLAVLPICENLAAKIRPVLTWC